MAYTPEQTAILEREPLPPQGITSAEVTYDVEGTACSGYVARPDDDGQHPGVLVVHNWLGVTDAVRFRADMLARLGYVAFAVDVFGADVRPTPEEAPGVAGGFYGDQRLFRARLTARSRAAAGPARRRREPDRGDGLLLRRLRRAAARAHGGRPEGGRELPRRAAAGSGGGGGRHPGEGAGAHRRHRPGRAARGRRRLRVRPAHGARTSTGRS